MWSDNVGDVIVVPGDAVPGDGRDRIELGGSLPPELMPWLDTALVSYAGSWDQSKYGTGVTQTKYFGIGSKASYAGTTFYLFTYVTDYNSIPGNDQFVVIQSHTVSNATPDATTFFDGYGPQDPTGVTKHAASQFLYGSHLRMADNGGSYQFSSPALNYYRANWTDQAGQEKLVLFATADGLIHIQGNALYTGATIATTTTSVLIGVLPGWAAPAVQTMRHVRLGFRGGRRIDIDTGGGIYLILENEDLPNQGYLTFDISFRRQKWDGL